jgi:hypothetical protein
LMRRMPYARAFRPAVMPRRASIEILTLSPSKFKRLITSSPSRMHLMGEASMERERLVMLESDEKEEKKKEIDLFQGRVGCLRVIAKK